MPTYSIIIFANVPFCTQRVYHVNIFEIIQSICLVVIEFMIPLIKHLGNFIYY